MKAIAREELFLIGPPGHFGDLAQPIQVAPEELVQFPLVLPGAQHGLRQFVEHEALRLGIDLTIEAVVDPIPHICNLVNSSRGFTISPLPAVASDLKDKQLSVARIGDSAFRPTLCLARNQRRIASRASRRVEVLALQILSRLILKKKWFAEPEAALMEEL